MSTPFHRHLLATTLIAGLSVASPALAQTVATGASTSSAQETETADEGDVVVTGGCHAVSRRR